MPFSFRVRHNGCLPRVRARSLLGLLAALLCAVMATPAAGEEPTLLRTPPPLVANLADREVWSGAEAFRNAWALYAGVTYAPAGITEQGLRLRVVAGQSAYRYRDGVAAGQAAQPFADLLVGYQVQMAALTLKLFGGVGGFADLRAPGQIVDLWAHSRFGPKIAAEAWWTINDSAWASFDNAFSGAQSAFWSRARAGLRMQPSLSLGPEVAFAGDIAHLSTRLGGFARYEWRDGEVGVSAGFARDGTSSAGLAAGDRQAASSPYATLMWLQRF